MMLKWCCKMFDTECGVGVGVGVVEDEDICEFKYWYRTVLKA